NTRLFAYPFHLDELQKLVESRPILGVLYLEVSDFNRVEWLCGWQTFDQILGSVSHALAGLKGDAYPPSALLAATGVHGGGFLLFIPENFLGSEPSLPDLETMGGGLARRVHGAVCHQIPEEVSSDVEITAGYALLRCEPVFRIERLIYRAIE